MVEYPWICLVCLGSLFLSPLSLSLSLPLATLSLYPLLSMSLSLARPNADEVRTGDYSAAGWAGGAPNGGGNINNNNSGNSGNCCWHHLWPHLPWPQPPRSDFDLSCKQLYMFAHIRLLLRWIRNDSVFIFTGKSQSFSGFNLKMETLSFRDWLRINHVKIKNGESTL